MIDRINSAPPELRPALMQGLTVQRYRAYKEGIFRDSTTHHTFRCVDFVDSLPDNPQYSKSEIRLRLVSHDLPEIVTTDITAVEKEDDKVSHRMEVSEQQAARVILPNELQHMLQEFNAAGRLLKGEVLEDLPPPAALIAKCIDTVENDQFFHSELARWILSTQYNSDKVPSKQALSYTFRHAPTQFKSVSESDYPGSIKEVCLNLLKGKLISVRVTWQNVPEQLVPNTIKEGLETIDDLIILDK